TSTTSTTTTTRPPTTTTTTLGDTVSPSVPTALSASAPSCSQINLGWNPSTDSGGSGLKGYNVYRNSVFVKQVPAPGPTTSGTGPMTSSGFKDVFVAKYSAAGVPLWAKAYGERNDDEEALGVAMDGSGSVVVTGYFKQTVNFGTGPLTAAGTYLGDVFVAKYSASGAPLWVKQVGSSGFDKGTAIAVDGASNVLVTGYFNGTVNF